MLSPALTDFTHKQFKIDRPQGIRNTLTIWSPPQHSTATWIGLPLASPALSPALSLALSLSGHAQGKQFFLCIFIITIISFFFFGQGCQRRCLMAVYKTFKQCAAPLTPRCSVHCDRYGRVNGAHVTQQKRGEGGYLRAGELESKA